MSEGGGRVRPSSPGTKGVDGGIRDWLAGLSRRELAAALFVVLLAVGGAGAWYVRSLPRPVTVEPARAASGPASPAVGPSPAAAPVIVHVAGWVRRPGVYELRVGDRVVDALEAAGGARRGAMLDALNLAALLTDGQQVLVPRQADAAAAPAGSVPGLTTALVNINTADAAALETLPGIGEVLAATIIQYRDEHGPFGVVEELLEVSGIGEVTLEELRDLVTV